MLPSVDKNKNHNFFVKLSAIDTSKHEFFDFARTDNIAVLSYMEYPDFQIKKFNFCIDLQEYSASHFKYIPSFITYLRVGKPTEVIIKIKSTN